MAHSKKKNKPIDIITEKKVIADLLEKDIKTAVFMIKELKEVVENVKEIMYQQNTDINKELENLKGNQNLFCQS